MRLESRFFPFDGRAVELSNVPCTFVLYDGSGFIVLVDRSVDIESDASIDVTTLENMNSRSACCPIKEVRSIEVCAPQTAPNSPFPRDKGRVAEAVVKFSLTRGSSVARPTDGAPSFLVDCYFPKVLVAAP